MPSLTFSLLIFVGLGVFFLLFHLLLGMLVRPIRPEKEKLTIYECGEPTIGSAWVQFDLRYYVVALLFVIFDVEVVFFFPWATVFGKANTLRTEIAETQRKELSAQLVPRLPAVPGEQVNPIVDKPTAWNLAFVAFFDIVVFFGVLLVGFAYLWKRGDINWVRSTAAEKAEIAPATGPPEMVRAESPVTSQSA